MSRAFYFILLLATGSSYNWAQEIDTTRSADFLVEKILLGTGVLVGNVKFTGEQHAIGAYYDSANHVGIEHGIILTSGNAYYILGPNKTPRSGWASNAPGDEELERIARGKTFDASILEFDFVTQSETLEFDFIFASEEYLEYVGSKFNDVFAFFITSPEGEKINIATLPDGKTPITVNTVNHERSQQYYIDNTYINVTDPFVWDVRNRKVITNEHYLQEEQPPQYFTQFDGFTTVLTARAVVIPNEVYHIKIAIADVGDGILDSGVFLKAGSFRSTGNQIVELDDHFKKPINPVQVAKRTEVLEFKQSEPEMKVKKILQPFNILFEFDKAIIQKEYLRQLELVIEQWAQNQEKIISIKGHTDSHGSDEYNIRLSQRRAQAVAEALVSMGIPKKNLKINFYGEQQPLLENNTDFNRSRNRRVEIEVRD